MANPIKTILIVAIIGGVGYYAYKHVSGGAPGGAPGMAGGGMPVDVAQVVERDARQWREFSGRLAAVDSAMIRPRVAGIIEKIHFQEGQWVEKDAPLFTIDQRPYAAALQAAQARATLAEAEMNRAKTLLGDKAIPQREFDQRRNDAEVARSDLTRAKLDYEYTTVRSPVAGRVSRAEITVGNLVDGGGNAPVLTSVVSSDPIYADFDVDEQTYVRFLQPVNTGVEKLSTVPVKLVLGDSGREYEGRVQSFDNQVNTTSGTIRVRTVFDNKDGSLIPGLFARVRLGDATLSKSLLITERAIGTDQNKKFVLVVKDDNSTERREVKLDGFADGMRIVEEGLKPGDKIIVSGLQRVMMPGQPVTPTVVNMDGSAIAGSTPEAPKDAAAPSAGPATAPETTDNKEATEQKAN